MPSIRPIALAVPRRGDMLRPLSGFNSATPLYPDGLADLLLGG